MRAWENAGDVADGGGGAGVVGKDLEVVGRDALHSREKVREVAWKRHVCCVYLKVNKKIDATS